MGEVKGRYLAAQTFRFTMPVADSLAVEECRRTPAGRARFQLQQYERFTPDQLPHMQMAVESDTTG
jgi:hypothetical protein